MTSHNDTAENQRFVKPDFHEESQSVSVNIGVEKSTAPYSLCRQRVSFVREKTLNVEKS